MLVTENNKKQNLSHFSCFVLFSDCAFASLRAEAPRPIMFPPKPSQQQQQGFVEGKIKRREELKEGKKKKR
jgi:hypothetical protein